MSEATEREVLLRLLPELEDDGYEVYLQPNKPLIPEFFGDFHPDAIALRDDKNLVIEVIRGSPHGRKSLEQIRALLQGREKWELRVITIMPTGEQKTLQIQDTESISTRIAEVKQLAAAGHYEPAILLAWAAFEALARVVMTKQFARPQTPARLVDVLATEGYLTPTEADLLRDLAKKRNSFIHGELQVRGSEVELNKFVAVLETMLAQVTS